MVTRPCGARNTAPMPTAPKDATEHTRALTARSSPPFDDADFDRARRGLVTQHPTGVIESPFGVVWDVNRYDFVQPGAPNPDTVHPSLWRQAQLNGIHGLFEVAPGVWQARGYDISNITFVAGDTGWIVIDPLTVEPCAKACLKLANATLGERPVVAVIYTHSHTDHFGGVLGVTTQDDVDAGRCCVIAPEHFMRETLAENVIGGVQMVRRSMYQFGPFLPAGPRQHVDCGLGKAIPFWLPGLIAPTEDITHTGQELVVDGVRIVFQLTPQSEAPAEMHFFFPDRGWLCAAENCTHNMHNLVPIRGAHVRDALSWSKYINESLELFGRHTEVLFASHHWPRWGNDDIVRYLRLQRDLYRWIHDQTMRHANHGLVATEVAELLTLPPEFAAESHTTGYYGHLAHNVKAVYQRYLSWYDGNPAHLWMLPPVDAGRRYVELAGGPEQLLAAARRSFDAGDYRWVAELVNHLVFADPTNTEARELQADTLEQLGYQSESATFRNAYLMGAMELRQGSGARGPARLQGYLGAMTVEMLFDSLAVRLRAEDVGGLTATVNWTFTDVDERWVLGLDHRALHATAGRHDDGADVTVTTTRSALVGLVVGDADLAALVADGALEVSGDASALGRIFDHLDTFLSMAPLVEP
jgi:alkyl sulfatase BDS1-like metallo-beta-lactamase superfamily hydrolase